MTRSCKLCLTGYETNEHLARERLFTRGVWGIVSTWLCIPLGRRIFLLSRGLVELSYSGACMRFGQATSYVLWNVLKEHNMRTFNAISCTILDVGFEPSASGRCVGSVAPSHAM